MKIHLLTRVLRMVELSNDNKCVACRHREGAEEVCTLCVGFKLFEEGSPARSKTVTPSRILKYLPVAQAIASLSKDPSTKVGAVAFDENMNIVATGYNGFPRGVVDDPKRYENRELKYELICHAEQNLVAQAAYAGHSLKGSTVLLTSLFPCQECAKSLIQAGVVRLISPRPDTDPRWAEAAEFASLMFKEAGVEIIHYE